MKIKITKQEKEIEGSIEEGVVKPFGTSAHIPFSRKHLGKAVPVIVPSEPQYIWLLKESERKRIILEARKIILEEDGKLEPYRLKLLEDIEKKRFNLPSLLKIIVLLENKNKEKEITIRIRNLYKF